MHRNYLILAALLGGLAVALGAFGAHGLHRLTSDEKIIGSFQTGVQYQMYHALALLSVGILYNQFPGKFLRWAGVCYIAGVLLFSGSLYLITFFKIKEIAVPRMVGPVTPVGGLLLILGWVFLLVAVATPRKS